MIIETRFLPLPGTGAHLVAVPAGPRRVRLRTGHHLALVAAPVDLEAVLAGASAGAETAEFLRRLIAEVRAREVVDAERRWPQERRAIRLLGDGAVVDALERALAAWGAQIIRDDVGAAVPDGTGMVVGYAGDAQARRAWAHLDILPARGIAWLRAYREGECVFVDPLALDSSDPASAHVDARRRAAGVVPALVEAGQHAIPAARLDEASAALLVARMLQMIVAWAQEDAALDRYRRTLWKLVPGLGAVSEHIVLRHPDVPARVRR